MRVHRKKQSTTIFLAVEEDRQTVPKNVISPSRGVASRCFCLPYKKYVLFVSTESFIVVE